MISATGLQNWIGINKYLHEIYDLKINNRIQLARKLEAEFYEKLKADRSILNEENAKQYDVLRAIAAQRLNDSDNYELHEINFNAGGFI